MTRVFLTYLIPLALPFAVYFLWAWIGGKRGRKPDDPPFWFEGPWFWLIVCGFFLMAATLGSVAYFDSGRPDGTYTPSRFEDGRIIPGEIR